MLKLFAIAAATLTGALAGTPAFAGSPGSAPTVRVVAGDLDLATRAGVDRLDRRLAAAIRQVCPAYSTAGTGTFYNRRECLNNATRTAAAGRSRLLATAGTRLAANAR